MSPGYLNTGLNYSDFAPGAWAHGSVQKTKNTTKRQDAQIDKTLQGVLVNTYIKDKENQRTEMDEICNSLIIPDKFQSHPMLAEPENKKEIEEKDKKRSLLRNAAPYIASALLATGMALAVSNSYLKSQKLLQPGNVPTGAKLPVVGKNINLKTEEYFAIYMAISEPKSQNLLALLGILVMSGLTYVGKTTVDGIKKVWLKKQEADVKKNYEEKIIETETKSFAGKLDVVREELVEKTKYFKEKIDGIIPDEEIKSPIIAGSGNIFHSGLNKIYGSFLTFRGREKGENKTEEKPKEGLLSKIKDSPVALAAVTALTLGLMFLGGKKVFKNISEGARVKEEALRKSREKIRQTIANSVDDYNNSSDSSLKDGLLKKIKEKLLSVGADSDEVEATFKKMGLDADNIKKHAKEVNDAVSELKFGDKFYVQADPAMGGKEGTQFYIYIDQAKGYIYDVITHPENKFARYLFSAITATGATGYVLKESVDALKEAAVIKENSNTELGLQKSLVDTEIRNFRSKKQSAIQPMMDEFDAKLREGKPKEELKVMAENILLEIKNGPPFVYA